MCNFKITLPEIFFAKSGLIFLVILMHEGKVECNGKSGKERDVLDDDRNRNGHGGFLHCGIGC